MYLLYICIVLILIGLIMYYNSKKIEGFDNNTKCYDIKAGTELKYMKTRSSFLNKYGEDGYKPKNSVTPPKQEKKSVVTAAESKDDKPTLAKLANKRNAELHKSQTSLDEQKDRQSRIFTNAQDRLNSFDSELEQSKRKINRNTNTMVKDLTSIGSEIELKLTYEQEEAKKNLESFLEKKIGHKLDQTVDEYINSHVQDVFSKLDKKIFSGRIDNGNAKIYDWQKSKISDIGQIRVNPSTGRIGCLSENGRSCATEAVDKINPDEVVQLDCSVQQYQDKNHWCNAAYKEMIEKYKGSFDFSQCPEGWSQLGEMCLAPENYNGGCVTDVEDIKKEKYGKLCDDGVCVDLSKMITVDEKKDWSKKCNTTFPVKVHKQSLLQNNEILKNKSRDAINRNLGNENIICRDTTKQKNFYKKGIWVNVHDYKGKQEGALIGSTVTSNVSFNWKKGSAYSIKNKNKKEVKDYFYIEMLAFIKVPEGINRIKFSLSGDDQSELSIANGNGELVSNQNKVTSVINNWNTSKRRGVSPNFRVKSGDFIPFKIRYTEFGGLSHLKLRWVTNQSRMGQFEDIPDSVFYIDNEPTNPNIKVIDLN